MLLMQVPGTKVIWPCSPWPRRGLLVYILSVQKYLSTTMPHTGKIDERGVGGAIVQFVGQQSINLIFHLVGAGCERSGAKPR